MSVMSTEVTSKPLAHKDYRPNRKPDAKNGDGKQNDFTATPFHRIIHPPQTLL